MFGPAQTPTTPVEAIEPFRCVVLEVVVEQVADRHREDPDELAGRRARDMPAARPASRRSQSEVARVPSSRAPGGSRSIIGREEVGDA